MNQHIQNDWANAAQQFQQLFGESWEKAVQSFQNLDLGTASMPGVGTMPSLTFSPEKLQELQAQYRTVLRMAQACIELHNGQVSAAAKQIDLAMKISEETGPGFCGPALCAKKAISLGNTDEARRWLARGVRLGHDAPYARREPRWPTGT